MKHLLIIFSLLFASSNSYSSPIGNLIEAIIKIFDNKASKEALENSTRISVKTARHNIEQEKESQKNQNTTFLECKNNKIFFLKNNKSDFFKYDKNGEWKITKNIKVKSVENNEIFSIEENYFLLIPDKETYELKRINEKLLKYKCIKL